MVNQRCSALILSGLVAALVLVAASAAAQAQKLSFTGTDTWHDFTSPGTWTCPAQPPPDGVPPCPEGSRIRVRGAVFTSSLSSPELGNANLEIVLNSNEAPDFTGPMWGTVSMAFAGGSICEGTWTGKESIGELGGNPVWIAVISAVAHCSGGSLDGMKLKATETATLLTPTPAGAVATVKGRLLNPGDE